MNDQVTTTFEALAIGDTFIEVMSTCNEIVTKIEPVTIKNKSCNALRSGGKMIFMADWEPVKTEKEDYDLE